MAGEIQSNYQLNLPTQLSKINSHGKLQVSNLNIGGALNGLTNVQLEQNKIVSKEKYTYQGNEGVLIKYDNGSVIFQANKQINGNNVQYQYTFKDEKAFTKKQPSSEILNPNSLNKRTTINYEYHRNGKIKNKETRKGITNTLVQQENYKKDGKIENRKVYDNKGKLIKNMQFTHNKDNSVDTKVYDKDNKLQYTIHTQYKPDGKTAILTESHYPDGALRGEAKFDDNGNIQVSTDYFEDGKVKAKTEYWDNGVIKEQEQFDESGKVTKKISAEIDGNFGESRQVGEGDCYLMATINSIRKLDNGQQMLNNLVKVETNENGEKIYKVTLPGAQVAAEGLRTDNRVDPNKMHITGEYSFTEAEMQEILKQAGRKYSLGDGDVILLEAAFEKYRNEVADTLKDNPQLKSQIGIAGVQTGSNLDNILAGGRAEDATFILTGRTSKMYMDNNVPNGLDYTAMTTTGELQLVPRKQNNNSLLSKAAVSEIDGKITNNKTELNTMLDEIMNDGKDGKIDNIATAGFKVIHEDGTEGGHRLTIKSVTKDTVTLINPWHPDKDVTMSRQDFMQCCNSINIADTSKLPLTVADVQANPDHPISGGALASMVNNMQNTAGGSAVQNNTVANTEQNQQTNHEVKRGDNLWKIAKQKLGAKATATQIANYIDEVMNANPKLKWNSSHTSVMIRPGDNIILP